MASLLQQPSASLNRYSFTAGAASLANPMRIKGLSLRYDSSLAIAPHLFGRVFGRRLPPLFQVPLMVVFGGPEHLCVAAVIYGSSHTLYIAASHMAEGHTWQGSSAG